MKAALCIIILFLSLTASAQTLSGTVRNEAAEPVVGASIEAAGNTTVSDSTGAYRLQIPAGRTRLRITAVGFETLERSITATTEKESVINVVLNQLHQELQTVEITGRRERGYKNYPPLTGPKTNTALNSVAPARSCIVTRFDSGTSSPERSARTYRFVRSEGCARSSARPCRIT